MSLPHLIVVGSANVDYVMKVPQLPKRGETVTDGEFLRTFGGKGANQAVAAARAGANVSWIGCLGCDEAGDSVYNTLKADGIVLDGVVWTGSHSTGAALVMVGADGANYLTVAPGSNHAITPEHLKERATLIQDAGMLLLQMEIPSETNLAAIQLLGGVPVILNYAPAQSICPELIAEVDTLVVNENEAATLTGFSLESNATIVMVAERLKAMGPSQIVITLGGKGCFVIEDDRKTFLPAFKVAALDTTAAGDTFCGALATGLLEGLTLVAAAQFATGAAAITIQRLGAQPSIPLRAEIDDFLGYHQLS